MATRRSFLSLASTYNILPARVTKDMQSMIMMGQGFFTQLDESTDRNAQDEANFRVKLKRFIYRGR